MDIPIVQLWYYFLGWLLADCALYYFGQIKDVHMIRHEDATVAFFLILVTVIRAIVEKEELI